MFLPAAGGCLNSESNSEWSYWRTEYSIMKGMAICRVLRGLDRIGTPKSTVATVESDREDIYAPLSTPLLSKRSGKQSSSTAHCTAPSTPSGKRTRQLLSYNGTLDCPLSDPSNVLCPLKRRSLGCVAFGKRRKSMVTLVVGEERQLFKVQPQMLEHRLLECLMARTKSSEELMSSSSSSSSQDALWEKENVVVHCKKGSATEGPIRLDCDAILFEHILWLLNNDDPAIRQLNIEELMEFYE